MCRFTAYIGQEKQLLAKLLTTPSHSLIQQSKAAQYGTQHLHADGFGVAWYQPHISQAPGVFKSIRPAWGDRNLKHLCEKTDSPCFLGHIRSSTIGNIQQSNCHPFIYKNYSFVHNGTIDNFNLLKRTLINFLPAALFDHLQGSTDSECLFLLILQFLENNTLTEAILEAIRWIHTLHTGSHLLQLNIVLTDGHTLLATRYSSGSSLPLHYLNTEENTFPESLVVSSEPLEINDNRWESIPENHMVRFTPAKTFDLTPIKP